MAAYPGKTLHPGKTLRPGKAARVVFGEVMTELANQDPRILVGRRRGSLDRGGCIRDRPS